LGWKELELELERQLPNATMCRWITVLSSDEVSLSDIVLAPSNSLVQMAIDASFHPGNGEINNHVMNGAYSSISAWSRMAWTPGTCVCVGGTKYCN
jgi:hypothetical protein